MPNKKNSDYIPNILEPVQTLEDLDLRLKDVEKKIAKLMKK